MRILVPVDESLHSRRVIEFISHRETLLGTCLLYTSPSPRDA